LRDADAVTARTDPERSLLIKVFSFDPRSHAARYAEQGWVHIRDGLTPDFLASVEKYARSLEDHKLDDFAIRGKKEQALYEFGSGVDVDELYDTVATLCGLERSRMTMSERHFQIYDAAADPEPPAHKDRYPSQVSVGLSIAIPEESRLVLYPEVHRGLNPFNTSADLRRSLQPGALPEVVLRGAPEVELDDRRGDVVAFNGSTTWHLRRNAARAVNLYLKFNDFGCDPLGEDPHTERIRRASRDRVVTADGALGSLVPVLARSFDSLSRTYVRDGWTEVLHARVFGEEPFGVTPEQFGVLQAADGRRTIDELITEVAAAGDRAELRAQVARLVELGALDIAE
jgi:hypothetical protein